MNSLPRRTLKRIVDRYGPDLVDDPRRTEALLNDLCPDYRREIFVLVNAQRQQVPAELLAAPRWMPRNALNTRLVRRLQDKLSLTEDAAIWAVDAWSFALGKTPETPTARSPLFPRRKPATAAQPTSADAADPADTSGGAPSSPAADPAAPAPPAERRVPRPRDAQQLSPLRRFLESPLMWVAAVSVTLLAVIALFDGTLSTASPAATSPAAAQPLLGYAGAAQPGELLTRVYPLPRTAWVNTDVPLNVRPSPSLDNEPLTKLAYGDTVTVDDYSADATWSHITEPAVGWVSSQYLNYVAETSFQATALPAVQLAVEELAVAAPFTSLRTGPDLTAPIANSLPANTPVTAVAATLDGQWRHLALPAAGWVPATDLAP